jgi:ectoine hydroxylase-related dioxygenase (phytanoyl-CoA dioxygenase family)
MMASLEDRGYVLWSTSVNSDAREVLRQTVFRTGEAGTRCLLHVPAVSSVARAIGRDLIDVGVLASGVAAIQAIAFDKSADTNWKVTWHQDLMFPFDRPVCADGYELASVKDGVDFARPPRAVLEDLLAVRVHLDDCDDDSGPLRVVPGSHRSGIIPSAAIQDYVASRGEIVCTAKEGEALLMRPLLLHASSKAVVPRHRRVLHLVYYSGAPIPEKWHRVVLPNQSELKCSGAMPSE